MVHILQTQSEPVSETDYVRKYENKLKKTEINPAITYIHDSFEVSTGSDFDYKPIKWYFDA